MKSRAKPKKTLPPARPIHNKECPSFRGGKVSEKTGAVRIVRTTPFIGFRVVVPVPAQAFDVRLANNHWQPLIRPLF